MAGAVARLTVKSGTIIAQRSSVGVAATRSIRFSSGTGQSTGGFAKNHKSRRLWQIAGGGAVSLAALAAFIKLRSSDNLVNAVSLKRRMVIFSIKYITITSVRTVWCGKVNNLWKKDLRSYF